MRVTRALLIALLILLSMPHMYAQEKQAGQSQESQPPALPIPLKAQFLVTEYDGEKKITSLPYTATMTTSPTGRRETMGSLRAGARIPVATGSSAATAAGTATPQANTEFQYIDVGTNIDFWVWQWPDNRYLVSGNLELSSLFAKGEADEPKDKVTGETAPLEDPIVHQARGFFSIVVREGQPGEAISLTDPITGRVFKLEVTVNTVK